MAHERSQAHEDYYIVATKQRADERTRVIKHGDSFGVFDHAGMIRRAGLGELGLYHEGTRFLSSFEIAVERRRPMLLNSTVLFDNTLNVDLANPDLPDRETPLRRDSVHLFTQSLLWERAWHARLLLHNYALHDVELELSLLFDADYADIFEVRGTERLRRGRRREPVVDRDAVMLGYEGLDGIRRSTHLVFDPAPTLISPTRSSFIASLPPQGHLRLDLIVSFELGAPASRRRVMFDSAQESSAAAMRAHRTRTAELHSNNAKFDEWVDRASLDLDMMVTATPHGPYPYAGVPWFSTPFGRDAIITAYECLWLDPGMTRGVLSFLAATQATDVDPENDAEPGKIVHEIRGGEMAALGEVPFARYYGSIDATPLFVMLAGAYYARTADLRFIESIWPSIDRALDWMERYGDVDGDGFMEYTRKSRRGLASQGWKDSTDSVSHADGSLATGPIALCEVQGYAYAARRAGAELARMLGHSARAAALHGAAEHLRQQFEQMFWDPDLDSYVLALDGDKRRCAVRASNAGHCLWTGIASPERAARVVELLMGDRMFSGWGIRTLAAGERRYNPLSYHNGSVWPHDNALIAKGMARYGYKRECARLLEALYDASLHFDLRRMPELFCGFKPRPHEGPTLYPVACSPQAWAAASVFMLLQACLGLQADARHSRIVLDKPVLPSSVQRLTIRDLAIGDASVDLVLDNHIDDVSVHLEHRRGEVSVVIEK